MNIWIETDKNKKKNNNGSSNLNWKNLIIGHIRGAGNTANNIKNKDTNTNRKLNAFNLGNIISEGQGSKGIGKLPNPPIKIGIIIKDVVNNPWNVIIGLYCGGGHKIKPGEVNSILNIRGKP